MAKATNKFQEFKFIDLFAGIGGIRIPFEELGGTCVFTSEWDTKAQETYEANFGEKPFGDITEISPDDIPDHDVLLAGFPCQTFSIIGDKKGFSDTRGTLFFNIEAILQEKMPAAFLLENVKNLKGHDKGRTFATIIQKLEQLGYHVHTTILNALDFGLPQKRERTFIVGFRKNLEFNFPLPLGDPPSLSEILEDSDSIDPALFASDTIVKKRLAALKKPAPVPSVWHENVSGNVSPRTFSCALRASASYNYLLVNGIRRLSPRELLRLQGFPESYRIVVSYTHIRKQTGNSVAVPVIRAVALQMLDSLRKNEMKAPEPSLPKQTVMFSEGLS